ncbi:hypothetical protein BKI52_41215 [marine bacterium AO1-C]|nr:hypothetical protein BKI52_41215 [marine bacterium AO1-C]
MLKKLTLFSFGLFLPVISLFAQTPLIDSIKRLPEPEQIAVYKKLVYKYFENDLVKTTVLIEEGLKLARKREDKKAIIFFILNQGNLLVSQGKFAEAMVLYKKILSISKEINYQRAIANIYNNMGIVYARQGKYDLSMKHYLKALKIHELNNNQLDILRAHNNLGNMHVRLKNPKKALEQYQKALDVSKKLNKNEITATLLGNISRIYISNQQFPQALKELRESLSLAEKVNDYRQVIISFNNIAEVYQKQNKLDSALIYSQKALKAHQKHQTWLGMASIYLTIAKTYNLLKKPALSGEYYQKALKNALKYKEMPVASDIYHSLHKLHASRQQYQKAYDYLLKYNRVKDSLFSIEKSKQIEELKAQYELDKKQKQVALMAKENKIKTLELQQQKSTKQALFLAMGILGILFLLLINRYRIKRKSNQLLAQKNLIIAKALREKEMLLKEVHHRVKNNLQIISSLLNLQGKFNQKQDPTVILKQSQHKIQTMAIIHEKLYQSDSLASIDLKNYLESLIQHFKNGYDLAKQNIAFVTQIDKITLKMDHLVPCGLIINELITNSLKYAFPTQPTGQIHVKATQQAESCILVVEDNGIGLPPEFTLDNLNSLGLHLVQGLADQLRGSFELLKSEGAGFKITFSI